MLLITISPGYEKLAKQYFRALYIVAWAYLISFFQKKRIGIGV
jgi:hypothetical protein